MAVRRMIAADVSAKLSGVAAEERNGELLWFQ
jgi:hypothetical protein